MQKITTFLTFDDRAEEAVTFYTSLFKRSRIVSMNRTGDAGPGPKGKVLTVTFELDGQRFMALNGGPYFQFSDGMSLMVKCETQAEIDDYAAKLTADGGEQRDCGWLTDRFGVRWQIVPAILDRLLDDSDRARFDRVMAAMMTMKKLDLAALERAYGK